MPKLYCASCGHPTIYDTSRPQFCSSCGKSFSDSIAVKTKRSVYAKPQKYDIDDDDDDDADDEDYGVSHGGELSVDKLRKIREGIRVEIDEIPHSTGTVGAVMRGGSLGGAMGLDDGIRDRHKRKISKKEFLREWQTKNGAEKPVASKEVGAGVKANALLAEKRAPQKKKSSRRSK